MRLIDLDAFREEYDLWEHCEDCGRRYKKACDYPSYSARDFCGWLDDAPTVDAVPLDALCALLAKNADCPPEHSPVQDHCKENCAECWNSVLKEWMEEQDGTDNP